MKVDFISCYLLLQHTLRNVSCDKNKLRPNNGIIAQLSNCTQVVRSPLLYLLFHLSGGDTFCRMCGGCGQCTLLYNTPSTLSEADEMLPKSNTFKQYDIRKKELVFLVL